VREVNEITGEIVDAAYGIHTRLGPGLMESVYETVLARVLERRGFKVERQRVVSFEYDGVRFDEGFRVDLLVDDRVVVELKSVERIAPVHPKQLLTYLRLLNVRVGLLLNFGAPRMKEGIRRVVNDYNPQSVLRVSAALCENAVAVAGPFAPESV
jgi:iron complex transport system substrate-binding protein